MREKMVTQLTSHIKLGCFVITGSILWSMIAYAAAPINVVIEPSPQATQNTCQSYALAFALSSAANSPYEVSTTGELRTFELDLRAKIESVAKAMQSSTTNHDVWKRAVREYTSNTYSLTIEEFPDIVQFLQKVSQLTGIWNASQLGTTISSMVIDKPVLTSVNRVGNDNYSGHIVSLLGVDGGLNSSTKILILNPAVKHNSQYKNSCDMGSFPGGVQYSAVTALTNDYEIKSFGGVYRLLWID